MQALILAAGMGRRMGKYTENCTKCMMTVAGQTLLERTVEALKYAGIDRLVMVIGYEAEKVCEYVASKNFGISVEYVYNCEYETTNNIYSLYLARDYLKADDTILLESDLIFDKEIIEKIIQAEDPNLAVVARYEQWMDGTVVVLNARKRIVEFVDKTMFRYEDVDRYYKTVNIYKFSKEFSEKLYLPFLEAYLKAYGTSQYYEQVLKIFVHIKNSELCAYVLEDENWYEIDDTQDLDIASTIFADEKHILKNYEQHFGGYWRFPKMKDFCYLVNPYYPPAKMLKQISYFFDKLLIQYPSGMEIQKLNASNMFQVDEEYLLVGNGAAELIQTLGRVLKGKVSVCIPTFNEYVRCFSNCEIREIDNAANDYQYNLQQLLKEIDDTDNLCIINPDNPSGAFLTFEEIIQLIEKCEEKEVFFIVDESFIDFTEKSNRYTLVKESLLKQYPHLIVLKSIGKSYGVPGLRLGIMATGNRNLQKKIRKELSIWNVNSFAEYFLQIQRLYRKDYIIACNKIARIRTSMQQGLSKIKGIKVYPSQANYIMCEVAGEIDSEQLAMILITKYNILIKNLSSKKGFFGKSFIRLAVKSEEDNAKLLSAIREIISG